MIWLYLAWLTLLIGSSIAFYHQHPEYLNKREQSISNSFKERIALLSMYVIAKSHFQNDKVWSSDNIAKHFAIPTAMLKTVLTTLEKHGFIIKTGDNEPIYVPARAPENIMIKDILDIIRVSEGNSNLSSEDKVEQLIKEIDMATEQVLKGRTLKDLVI